MKKHPKRSDENSNRDQKERFDPDLYDRYVGRYQKEKKRPRRVLKGEERERFKNIAGQHSGSRKERKRDQKNSYRQADSHEGNRPHHRARKPEASYKENHSYDYDHERDYDYGRKYKQSYEPDHEPDYDYDHEYKNDHDYEPDHGYEHDHDYKDDYIYDDSDYEDDRDYEFEKEDLEGERKESEEDYYREGEGEGKEENLEKEEGPLLYSERRIDPETGIIEERKIYHRSPDSLSEEDSYEEVGEWERKLGSDGLDDEGQDRDRLLEERRLLYGDEEGLLEEEAPKKSIWRRIKRAFLAFLALLIVLLVIDLSICYSWDRDKKALPVPAADQGNRLNFLGLDMIFLLAGVDDAGEGVPQRTDTLMLVRLNFLKGETTILSIPRDTYVNVNGNNTKINHAYAYGGPELTVETLRDLLGIDLDYYLVVDYDTVKSMIDAMGGVHYDIPEEAAPVEGEDYEVGEKKLNGEEALFYLRHRQGYPNADLDRIKAQQEFLKEASKQAMSPKKFFRWPKMLNTMASHTKTNIPALPMIPRAIRLPSMMRNSEQILLPGRGAYLGGTAYYLVDESAMSDILEKNFRSFLLRN